MSYIIDFGGWGSVFAVPTSVVDKGLKLASESQLKVLLYVLRHSGETLTAEKIGEELSLHSEDVKDAVSYWEDMGIFCAKDSTLSIPAGNKGTCDQQSDAPPVLKENTVSVSEKPRPVSRPTKPEPGYVAKRLRADSNIVCLMDEAQRILSKVLSNSDTATLLMLHDTDGLPIEVILMLLEHCVQIGKGNMRYIERTGIQWGSEGITSIALAEEKIRRYSESTGAWAVVSVVFGIRLSGTPSKKQLEFADRWINEWNFSESMLRLAYERCLDTKGEMNLSYINGILKRWYEQGLTKPDDVLKADASNKKNVKPKADSKKETASYNIDEYENYSIFDD